MELFLIRSYVNDLIADNLFFSKASLQVFKDKTL